MPGGMGNGISGGKTHFRFDNGFENPSDGGLASYIVVTDTDPVVLPPNSKFRLRWAVERFSIVSSANFSFQFDYKLVGEALWAKITPSSSVVNLVASDFVNNRDDSTAYTGDPGDLDEKLYRDNWTDLTNEGVLTDEPTGETGVSFWLADGSNHSLSIEASFRLDPTLEGGTKFQIHPMTVGDIFGRGYDIEPVIEVGRRVFNRS